MPGLAELINGADAITNKREAVHRAAQILDREVPGWHRKMKPEKLYMSNTSLCALGQLFGSSIELSIAKELFPEEWRKHGGGIQNGFSVGLGFLLQRIFGNNKPWTDAYAESKDEQKRREAAFLVKACGSADELKCHWAREVAERCMKEADDAP